MTTANALIVGTLAVVACLAPLAAQAPPQTPSMAVAWQTDVPLDGRLFIAAGRHAIVVAGSLSGMSAHAPDDGRALWQHPAKASGAPVALGRIVVCVVDGSLLALDQATGHEAWRVPLDAAEPLSSLGLAATDALVHVVRGPEIHAWRADGTAAWHRTLPSPLVTPIVSGGKVLMAGLEQPAILAMDPATGATRWTARLDEAPTALAVAEDRLFVPTAGGEFYAYRVTPAGLKKVWRYRDRAIPAVGPPATSGRRVFYALLDNTLQAFGRDNGARVWTAPLGSRALTGPVVLGDEVVVPLASGQLAQVSAATGKAAPPQEPKPAPRRMGASASEGGSLYAIATAGNDTTTLIAWRPAR